jgi:putative transposase
MKFRHPSDREIRRLLLADTIAEIHARSRGTYGMLRIRAALEIEQGLIVNKKLVWKIMRELGLHGLPGELPPLQRTVAVGSDHAARAAS